MTPHPPASQGIAMENRQIPLVAILAGGKSSRMGMDKAELMLSGMPIIEHVWNRVSSVASEVVIVGGAPKLEHLGVKTISDDYFNAGSLGGIATALNYCRQNLGADGYVLCIACDMPFIKEELLVRLWGLRYGCDVVVPRTGKGFEPLCALYGVSCLKEISGRISSGRLKIQQLFSKVRTRELGIGEILKIDPEVSSFININSPDDLTAARNHVDAGWPAMLNVGS